MTQREPRASAIASGVGAFFGVAASFATMIFLIGDMRWTTRDDLERFAAVMGRTDSTLTEIRSDLRALKVEVRLRHSIPVDDPLTNRRRSR